MYSSHTKTTASLLILQISAYAVTSPRNGYSSRSFFLPEHGNINAEQTSSMSSSSSLARQESQQKNKMMQCQLAKNVYSSYAIEICLILKTARKTNCKQRNFHKQTATLEHAKNRQSLDIPCQPKENRLLRFS